MTDYSALSDTEKKSHAAPLASADELHAYIPYLLLRIGNRWNVTQNRVLAEYGANNIVLRTLSILHIFRTLTVNEIAVLAVTEQSSTSRMIDTMVAAGLVERHISETDLRRRDIAITDKGEELLKESWPLMSAHYERLIKDISPEDLAVTTRVLGKMVENIREHAI
jgi:DNA-binding MarR family transcriptional regulator